MNDKLIVMFVTILILICGILILIGKGRFLIAGYNILSETCRKLDLYEDAAKYYSKLFRCSTTPNYMKQKAQNNWLDYNNR